MIVADAAVDVYLLGADPDDRRLDDRHPRPHDLAILARRAGAGLYEETVPTIFAGVRVTVGTRQAGAANALLFARAGEEVPDEPSATLLDYELPRGRHRRPLPIDEAVARRAAGELFRSRFVLAVTVFNALDAYALVRPS